MTQSWTSWPAPAKLNLFLHIVGRRADGYHLLQTVFQLLDWGDTVRLRVRADGQIARVGDVPGVPPEQDLCLRAAQALRQQSAGRLGVDIALDKRIPLGGGLGGGSSDAATVLVALNDLWLAGLSPDQLAGIALGLGADVPVFVGGYSAWAEGVGEKLTPIALRPRHYVIVDPGVSVKPYPCGSLSHPSMDAMLKVVVDNDLKPGQIKAVRLRAGNNILEPLRYTIAKTELEAKFSVPFLMSAIILQRRAGMREFTDEFVASAPVQAMMPKVTAVHDLEIEKQGFDKIRSVVEVDLVDGRKLVQPSDDRYRGGPDNPFSRADLQAKFEDTAQLVLPQAKLGHAFATIESVDSLGSVRALIQALKPTA